jgi:hypothetical protein
VATSPTTQVDLPELHGNVPSIHRTGLTAGLSAALPSPAAGHDRSRVFAGLACAIADGPG